MSEEQIVGRCKCGQNLTIDHLKNCPYRPSKSAEEEEEDSLNLTDLLEAPCIFCNYNGSGYYQEKTHNLGCPWRDIGGLDWRLKQFPTLIKLWAAKYWAARRDAEKGT